MILTQLAKVSCFRALFRGCERFQVQGSHRTTVLQDPVDACGSVSIFAGVFGSWLTPFGNRDSLVDI